MLGGLASVTDDDIATFEGSIQARGKSTSVFSGSFQSDGSYAMSGDSIMSTYRAYMSGSAVDTVDGVMGAYYGYVAQGASPARFGVFVSSGTALNSVVEGSPDPFSFDFTHWNDDVGVDLMMGIKPLTTSASQHATDVYIQGGDTVAFVNGGDLFLDGGHSSGTLTAGNVLIASQNNAHANVGFFTDTPLTPITFNKGIQFKYAAKTPPSYTVTTDDFFLGIDARTGSVTLTFPAALSGYSGDTFYGRMWVVKDVYGMAETNPITIKTQSPSRIDGQNAYDTASADKQYVMLNKEFDSMIIVTTEDGFAIV